MAKKLRSFAKYECFDTCEELHGQFTDNLAENFIPIAKIT